MKYLEEYRDKNIFDRYIKAIKKTVTKEWTLMEICGGQTHSLIRSGIDMLLYPKVRLVHGPGCPVCVTPVEFIDKAIKVSSFENTILCSYGDMLRVPGSKENLLSLRAKGKDIRTIYSPMDAIETAKENPTREVVFFAIGFETTAPGNAMAIFEAKKLGLKNFSALCCHVLVPPALELILSSKNNKIQGILAAGHVCTVMGSKEYEKLSMKYSVPIVITGFEPLDLLQGIHMCVKQLENNIAKTEIQYSRSVKALGNEHAKKMTNEVFELTNRKWRGLGEIPLSGLKIKDEYKFFDAEHRFDISTSEYSEKDCIMGEVLLGIKKPTDCPLFMKVCTPSNPRGAAMVSSEGACAAYSQYRTEKFYE